MSISLNFLGFFFSHRPFSCYNVVFFRVGGAKSVADIDTGGPKSLHFDKFTMLSLLFLPRSRGPNSIANFDGGVAGFAPLDPPLSRMHNREIPSPVWLYHTNALLFHLLISLYSLTAPKICNCILCFSYS